MKTVLPLNSHNLNIELFIEVIDIEEIQLGTTEFKSAHCKWRIIDVNDRVIIPPGQPYIRTHLPVMIYKMWDKTDNHFVQLLIEYLTPMHLHNPGN